MTFESFLENLYFGKLDYSTAKYFESPAGDTKVLELLTKYREACRDFPPDKLESLGRVPEELLQRLRDIGFFGLYIPVAYGGVGLSLYQYLAVVKEMVKMDMALGILALAHLSIGVKAIWLFGSEEQKKKYLPPAASGKMIFCYALTEPKIGSDARNIDTQAETSEDGRYYILNGTKTLITNANYSGGMTVFAQMDRAKKGSLGAFIVETAWPGVSVGQDMEKMGLKVSSTATIRFKDVKVPRENLIGRPGDGFKIAMTVLNYGRLALGASSAGGLEASFQDMLKRAAARVQFERPIVEFELIQEKIARAWMENQAVWAMTNFTAGLLDKNATAYVALESSHCKLYGTNRAWDSLYDAMQTAGGSGYLSTQPYEKRMRDARVATIFEGTSEIHSVYPPVTLLRNLSKQLFSEKMSSFRRTRALAALRFARATWKAKDRDPLLVSALRAVKKHALTFRKLFLSGLRKYGRAMPDKEYLLRRLTLISVQLLILVSLVFKIRMSRTNRMNADDSRTALAFFISQAEAIARENNRLKPDARERLSHDLIDRLKGGVQGE